LFLSLGLVQSSSHPLNYKHKY
jgi:hypothetical protein